MSRRLKSEVLSVRNVIHHNEAENEEFVFYDDDKRFGARGADCGDITTLGGPGTEIQSDVNLYKCSC